MTLKNRIVEVVTIVFGISLIVFLVTNCPKATQAELGAIENIKSGRLPNYEMKIMEGNDGVIFKNLTFVDPNEEDTLSSYDKQIREDEDALKQLEADRESFYKQKMKTTFVSLWALEEARKEIYPNDSFRSSSSGRISTYMLRQIANKAGIIEGNKKPPRPAEGNNH